MSKKIGLKKSLSSGLENFSIKKKSQYWSQKKSQYWSRKIWSKKSIGIILENFGLSIDLERFGLKKSLKSDLKNFGLKKVLVFHTFQDRKWEWNLLL